MTHLIEEKSHAELGASTASRWMACPGSVRLSRGLPDPTSEYAREGTAAHALAELSLRKLVDPETYVGTTLEGVEVTDDMAEYVRVFVDYCRASIGLRNIQTWVEKQFSLQHLNPPGPMFGTADFVSYDLNTRTLEVVDFKYGQGVVVDAFENKQLLYYALGAALSLEMGTPIEEVKVTIVQPRASHRDGVIRSFTLDYVDLLGYAGELLAAARATTAEDAPLVAGSHCRFCRAAGTCPAQRDAAQSVAMIEFSVIETTPMPTPDLIPLETLAEYAEKFYIVEAWMAAVRGRLQGALERGEAVPGYKLVAKRANRSWVNPEETAQWLKAKGNKDEEIYKQELKSPAQIEKLIGKKNLPPELTQKRSSGWTMVPASDAREAIAAGPGEDFAALPATVGGSDGE